MKIADRLHPPSPKTPFDEKALPRIVAHRGGAALWPENSMAAFRGASALGVQGIELDVRLSRDGVAMVHHDKKLERTTTGRGLLGDATAAALRTLLLKGPGRQRIPLLTELLPLFRGPGPFLSLELKPDGQKHADQLLAVESFLGRLAPEKIFVHSFDWALCRRAKARWPGLEIGANVDGESLVQAGPLSWVLHRLAGEGLHHLNIDHRLFDERHLNLARRLGFRVTLWTANAPADLARWMHAGVDAIATDRPDLALGMRQVLLEKAA
jgi:glycerophosphoryl diester phosphodiesterase